jgi:hypothetical protein
MPSPRLPKRNLVYPWRCTLPRPDAPSEPCRARGTAYSPARAQQDALDHIAAVHDPKVAR